MKPLEFKYRTDFYIDSSNIGNRGEIYYIKEMGEKYPDWDTLKLSESYIDSLYLSGLLMNSKGFFRNSEDSISKMIIKEYKERDGFK